MQIITKRKLDKLLSTANQFHRGCLVDTSVLFAAIMDTDIYNEIACDLLNQLILKRVPLYINVSIRAEFLNNMRRVVIGEAAIDLYEDFGSQLPDKIFDKFRSLRNRAKEAVKQGKVFRLHEEDIRQIKILFHEVGNFYDEPIWDLFCDSYLKGKIQSEWNTVVTKLGINTLSFAGDSKTNYQSLELAWEDVVRILESSTIGSSDAMIISHFVRSDLMLAVTADEDLADVIQAQNEPNKTVCFLF